MFELFGIGAGLMLLLIVPLALLLFAFWIWMLVDAAIKEEGTSKVAWVIIVVFLHLVGAAVYFFARKLPRKA